MTIIKPFRTFILSFSVALLSLSSALVFAASNNFSASELTNNILLVTGPSGNTLVVIDDDVLVLVDGVAEQYAAEYLDFIYQETGISQVKTLFNTHWHPEPVGLNATLGQQGVNIVAHENTRLWLNSTIRKRGDEIIHTPVVDYALPTETIYDKAEKPFAGGAIEYGYMVQAHTDGDLYVYFPQQNILYTGGMARSDDWAPVDEVSSGFFGGMLDAYVALTEIANEKTVIVPASGPVMNKVEFQAQHEMYQEVMTNMVALLVKSQSPAEAVLANPTEGLKPEWGDPSEFVEQGFRSYFGHLRNARFFGAMP